MTDSIKATSSDAEVFLARRFPFRGDERRLIFWDCGKEDEDSDCARTSGAWAAGMTATGAVVVLACTVDVEGEMETGADGSIASAAGRIL